MTSNALIGGSLMIKYQQPSGMKHLAVWLQHLEREGLLPVFEVRRDRRVLV